MSNYLQMEEHLPDALIAQIRAAAGTQARVFHIKAGGPLSKTETLLGDDLAWQVRRTAQTPTLGPTRLYLRGERVVRSGNKERRQALIGWLFSRGWTSQAVGDGLGICQSSTIRYARTGRPRGGVALRSPLPAKTAARLHAGIELVERIVFGKINMTGGATNHERVDALAKAMMLSAVSMERRCLRAAGVLEDVQQLATQAPADEV